LTPPSPLPLDLSPLHNLRLLRIGTPDLPTALRILSTLPFSSSHSRTVVIHRTHLAARFCAQPDGALAALEDVTLELEMPAITGDVRVDNYWEHFPLLRGGGLLTHTSEGPGPGEHWIEWFGA
jgi:hypothetical protein